MTGTGSSGRPTAKAKYSLSLSLSLSLSCPPFCFHPLFFFEMQIEESREEREMDAEMNFFSWELPR